MLGILIDLFAWLDRLRSIERQPAAGLEALFADTQSPCPIPLPNCETYGAEPELVVQPQAPDLERRRRLTAAYWYLREQQPEIWYAAPFDDVIDLAESLVTLSEGIEAGRWELEASV